MYTKGEWKVIEQPYNWQIVARSPKGGVPFTFSFSKTSAPDNESESNAQLISAAPDLLEACKVMRDFLNIHHSNAGLRDTIQKAINKAEGNTPL